MTGVILLILLKIAHDLPFCMELDSDVISAAKKSALPGCFMGHGQVRRVNSPNFQFRH